MTRRLTGWCWAVLCAAHLGACDPNPSTAVQEGGPSLRLRDSVVVRETDSLYIGGIADFALDGAGRFYIADRMFSRVVVASPSGAIERTLGRAGSGPGEFRTIGPIGLIGDSVLVALSVAHKRLNVYDARSGMPTGVVGHDGLITSLTPGSNGLWVGITDMTTRKMAVLLGSEDLRGRDSSRLVATLGELPLAYRSNQALFFTYGLAFSTGWGDTVLVGIGGSDTLQLLRSTGTTLGSRILPVRARRGIPPDFVRDVDLSRKSFAEIVRLGSVLFGLWRLPGGGIVVVHYDSDVVGQNTILSRPFVSILNADLTQGCMDTTLPVVGEVQPRVLVRGDTLFVIDQYFGSSKDRSTVVIRKYEISSEGCRWIPLESTDGG